jgi:hypothetical protein
VVVFLLASFNADIATKFTIPRPALQEMLVITVKTPSSTPTKEADGKMVNLKLKESVLPKPPPPTVSASLVSVYHGIHGVFISPLKQGLAIRSTNTIPAWIQRI